MTKYHQRISDHIAYTGYMFVQLLTLDRLRTPQHHPVLGLKASSTNRINPSINLTSAIDIGKPADRRLHGLRCGASGRLEAPVHFYPLAPPAD